MNFKTAVTRLVFTTLLIFASYWTTRSQSDSIYRLAPGTRITLKLDAEINSRVSDVNDTFIATVAKPVIVREVILLPVGTIVEGRVIKAAPASVGGKAGTLVLAFESIKFVNGVKREVSGFLVNELRGGSMQTTNLLSILGGAIIGTAIGAAARTGNGALIGAAIGAGAGTGVALARKGKDVRIRKGQEFEIELKKEVVLPVIDY